MYKDRKRVELERQLQQERADLDMEKLEIEHEERMKKLELDKKRWIALNDVEEVKRIRESRINSQERIMAAEDTLQVLTKAQDLGLDQAVQQALIYHLFELNRTSIVSRTQIESTED
jgi:hypothetical protein